VDRTFYLGAHHPGRLTRANVPLFVSRSRLTKRRSFPRASARWALDSGAFTELSIHGRWTAPPEQYAREVRLFSQEIGSLDFAAPQDWMCVPWILEKTGLSLAEHQRRTLRNFLELHDLAPDVPWIPVLKVGPSTTTGATPRCTPPPASISRAGRSSEWAPSAVARRPGPPAESSRASPRSTTCGSTPSASRRWASGRRRLISGPLTPWPGHWLRGDQERLSRAVPMPPAPTAFVLPFSGEAAFPRNGNEHPTEGHPSIRKQANLRPRFRRLSP
jgi:hypothetical protein